MVTSIVERIDDIFNAPPHSVLVHACNCRGAWGAGVAKEFKKKFPEAFKTYKSYCKNQSPEDIIGTALLIHGSSFWIACLFTSQDFGKKVDSPHSILLQTRKSILDLERQIKEHKEAGLKPVGPVWSVRINVGHFDVPWAQTFEVLRNGDLDMTVVRRPEDDTEEYGGKDEGGTDYSKPKKSQESQKSQDPETSIVVKSSNKSKSSHDSKASYEPEELLEPQKSTKPSKKAEMSKAKAKTKTQAPPKNVPPTNHVLRTRKPKPKVSGASSDDEPAKAKPKRVVKKKAVQGTTKAKTKEPKVIKKRAPPKPKTKKAAGKEVEAPKPVNNKRKRDEANTLPATAKKAKSQL